MEQLLLTPWLIWVIVAVAAFILEIFIPGFWVAILGIGALAAVPLAALGADTTWQILVLQSFQSSQAFFSGRSLSNTSSNRPKNARLTPTR